MRALVGNLHRLNEARSPYVLVTLTAIRGSAPQVVGSKMLVASGTPSNCSPARPAQNRGLGTCRARSA